MDKLITFLVSLIVVIHFCVSAIPSRADLGYSTGYLPDCPGSEKKSIILKKDLKHVILAVLGPGNPFSARKKSYSYHQMPLLAKDKDIDFRRKTVVYVIGYLGSANFPETWIMGTVYKEIGYNVLILDTNRFSTVHYAVASRFMRPAGLHAAEALANLTKLGLDPKKLELIGISLGAHLMSYIAKSYKKITGTNIGRLTGLDPAGPCFRNLPPDDRLDKTDADFVEIVHTNIDGFGMSLPIGHIDYYVNGGEYQPNDVVVLPCMSMCSHVKSFLLWHSVVKNPKKFIAIKCDTVQQARDRQCYDRVPMEMNYMGFKVDKKKQGLYYLATDYGYPYYLGMNGTKKEFDVWSRIADYNEEDVMTA